MTLSHAPRLTVIALVLAFASACATIGKTEAAYFNKVNAEGWELFGPVMGGEMSGGGPVIAKSSCPGLCRASTS